MTTSVKHNRILAKRAVGILYAGGDGTRLWPVSTPRDPKQINSAFSKDTMLVEAYQRARKLFPPSRILVVITRELYHKIKKLVDVPEENFLVQPENADTAPAMGLAAMFVEYHFPGAVAVTFYTDHLITNNTLYAKNITRAIDVVARRHKLLTIGTEPTFPNQDLGYIKQGRVLRNLKKVYEVEKFIEKPSEEEAGEFLRRGGYVWNTGIYVWSAASLLELFKRLSPAIYAGLINLRAEIGGSRYEKKLEEWYDHVKRESFEKAISEKTKDFLVLVGDYNWRDVGNWKTVYELASKDHSGHAVLGRKTKLVSVDAKNCLVLTSEPLVSLIGVEDLIIVSTKAGLLVGHKDHAWKVKKAVEAVEDRS